MRAFVPLTLAAAALASLVTPSFAEELQLAPPPSYLVPQSPLAPLAPPTAALADVTNPGYVYAQPDGAGQFDCQLDEKRTKMERKACGPLKDRFGE